jgi:hypothetical protein
MLPKTHCKLEITEIKGIKTVTYPNCHQEEFKFANDCEAFEDCYEHIKDRNFKTKFALGVYSQTVAKLETEYSPYAKTSLIIPKDSVITSEKEKYVEKAYVYSHAETYADRWGNVRRFKSDIRYQPNDIRINKLTVKGEPNKYNKNLPDDNLLIFKTGEETKLVNFNNSKVDKIRSHIQYYH